MPARTGKEFLHGLKDDRQVWVGDERVTDVVAHPALRGTPDYLNITFAGFAGRDDEWGAHGNEAGAAHLVAYQKHLARRDLALTHTLIHPTVDRAWGDAP